MIQDTFDFALENELFNLENVNVCFLKGMYC